VAVGGAEADDGGTPAGVPLLRQRPAGAGGAPLVYVCRGMVCDRPVATIEAALERVSSAQR
jgi:uncharacterized protein